MDSKNEFDPQLIKKLALLKTIPRRNPEREAKGRASFLQEAEQVADTVTFPQKRRHNRWMYTIQSMFMFRRKEHSTMIGTFTTIMLIVMLALGGGGVTAVAAQSSQPDQPLYDVKLWTEDIRLNLAADPQTQYELISDFANRRFEEIQTILQANNIPSEVIQLRYRDQLEEMIRFALNLPDDQAILALQQIQESLQTQQQTFRQAQTNGSLTTETVLLQTRDMIQERLSWVEEGLTSPSLLRDQFRQRDQLHQQDQQFSSTLAGQSTPLAPEAGGNPWTTGTPLPGSGYGPGECVDCTPVSDEQSGNPWTTGTPTPGSSYGPGPGFTGTPGSGVGSGSQSEQQQQGQPIQAEPQSTTSGTGSQQGGPGGNH